MSYMNQKFKNMKRATGPKLISIGMTLRTIVLLFIMASGKFFCDRMIEKSHDTVSDYDIEMRTKSQLKTLRNLKLNGSITEEQFIERAKEIQNKEQ